MRNIVTGLGLLLMCTVGWGETYVCNDLDEPKPLIFERAKQYFEHHGIEYTIVYENEEYLALVSNRVKGESGLVVEYAASSISINKQQPSFASSSHVHIPQGWITPESSSGECVVLP